MKNIPQSYTQEYLTEWLGPIDLYLLDQVFKGNLQPGMKILDAGCGHGRNIRYFIRSGYEVWAVDQNEAYVAHVQEMAKNLSPDFPLERISSAKVESMPFEDESFDAIISQAVLHFASSGAHFDQMIDEMWRVLKPGGLLFIRTASDIGIADRIKALGQGRFELPDGHEWFLVTENKVESVEKRLNATRVEAFKTTNVQHQRCMSTWVLMKN